MEEWTDLREAQGNLCAICETDVGGLWRDLNIDHDHATDTVRGLLCDPCNKGLGFFKDNPENLQKAINYLKFPIFRKADSKIFEPKAV